ncbi:MAG TPA: low affinity iron permease family protein [Candidatus Dormibacteraeota bacterium]
MRAASRLIDGITERLGSPIAVLAAIALVGLWLGGLPHFGVQDQNYQLLINTGTTIVTFIMVFCVQHTQNKDATAMQLKLDELIRSLEGARDAVAGIEKDADLLKEEAVRAADRVKGEAVKTAEA